MRPKPDRTSSLPGLARFAQDQRGNVAVVFGLTMLPLTFLLGAAIDYSAASDIRTRLQRATDATGLQLCQMPNNLTRAQYLDAARNKLLPSYLGNQKFEIKSLTVEENPHHITLTTSAVYDTAVVRIMGSGFTKMTLEADAQCQNQEQSFEIALVLDTTGSMANTSGTKSKMDAAKDAATTFVNYMFSAAGQSGKVKIALVPFAASVAVDPVANRYATWIDQAGASKYHWTNVTGAAAEGFKNRFAVFDRLKSVNTNWGWAGCIESLGYPRNVLDGAPTPSEPDSYYVPLFAPDEAGNTDKWGGQDYSSNNSYMDDGPLKHGACQYDASLSARFTQACKYKDTIDDIRTSQGGPNWQCTSRPLTRLTATQATLLSEISKLQPGGNTNIHQGFMWGWRTVSPTSVFADATAYSSPNVNKVIVLMTDGANTWNTDFSKPLTNSYYSAYGYLKNGDGSNANSRLPAANASPASGADTRRAIDALTAEACRNASAAPSNVLIYAVGFSTPADPIDQQGLDLLRNCAGSKDRFFVANDATGLMNAFGSIQKGLSGLKLTR